MGGEGGWKARENVHTILRRKSHLLFYVVHFCLLRMSTDTGVSFVSSPLPLQYLQVVCRVNLVSLGCVKELAALLSLGLGGVLPFFLLSGRNLVEDVRKDAGAENEEETEHERECKHIWWGE